MGDPRGGSRVKWEAIVIGGLRGKALRMCELGSSARGHECLKEYVMTPRVSSSPDSFIKVGAYE